MRNKSEILDCRLWMKDESILNPIWAREAGFLQSSGRSKRRAILRELIPHVILSGEGTYRCADKEYHLKEGDVFAVLPGIPYEFFDSAENPWSFYWFRLYGPGINDLANDIGLSPEYPVLKTNNSSRIITSAKKLFDYYALDAERRDHYRAIAMLYELAAALREERDSKKIAKSSRQSELVNKAISIMDMSIETCSDINSLCKILSVSRSTLLSAFKKETGTSPHEYLAELRLERAEELMKHSSWKLSAIASACGYRSDKYFMREFKKKRGSSPGRWRNDNPESN